MALLVGLLARDAAAIETCSRTYKKPATSDVGPGPAPLLIGDSVVGYAMPQIQRVGYRLNAQGCRTFPGGIRALEDEARKRKLPRLVVFELGTAGNVTQRHIGRVLRILGPKRKLVLITPRKFFGGVDPDAADYHRAARRHPERVAVVPWAEWGEHHPEWFYPDMVHPNRQGAKAFAEFLEVALHA